LIGTTGCRHLFVPTTAAPLSQPSAEVLHYRNAINLYCDGHYHTAAQHFDAIRAATVDPEMQRMALYGLACSRLMAAETPEAYQEGLRLWYEWVDCAPADAHNETPLLMVPFIREKAVFGNIPLTGPVSNELQQMKIVPAWKLTKATQEVENLKQQLDESDRVKKNAQKKIAALEKEIEELKSQIKALETIDQKIQKKKSAIPSAN
jgi:TolA-binding protein